MNNETDVKFGEMIKDRRLDMRLSQEELGKLVGISKIMTHYYETGKRGMTISQFFKFCDVLGLDPNEVQKKL